MNKNAENTLQQINNTLDALASQGIVKFVMPCEVNESPINNVKISWKNHTGGRSVSSRAFNMVEQYFAILSSMSYHAILIDYSIIRVSFTFENEKLLSQNLLWWPCPVKLNKAMEEEYGLLESIKNLIEDVEAEKYLNMRTPIRVDFDDSNNTKTHPRAHLHIQLNMTSRMNSKAVQVEQLSRRS